VCMGVNECVCVCVCMCVCVCLWVCVCMCVNKPSNTLQRRIIMLRRLSGAREVTMKRWRIEKEIQLDVDCLVLTFFMHKTRQTLRTVSDMTA
jgi:hypothetical protein